MNEVMDQKINSIFEIFIAFLIVDGDAEKEEFDTMFLEFFDYIEKYTDGIKPKLSFEDVIIKIAEDQDNFSKNANYLDLIISNDEKITILSAISNIVFSDTDFSDTEYELFKKLMDFWKITKEDLM